MASTRHCIGAILAATGAVLTIVASSPPALASELRHLYVAVEELSGPYLPETVYIARYPLNGWTIGRKPDLVIPNYAGPLAMDETGTLYAGGGQLTMFQTSYIAAFHFGSKLPFASYAAPAGTFGSSVMSEAVDKHGLLSFAYLFWPSGSEEPLTFVATYRTSDAKVVSNATVATGTSPEPIYGMAYDNRSRLYISTLGQIYAYSTPTDDGLHSIGSMFSRQLRTPGGLATTQTGQIYAADLPAPGKVTVSSYLQSDRGTVSPIRLLVPVGPDASYIPAPLNQILAYGIALQADKLFLPFFAPVVRKHGGAVSGVYEYSRFESGNSRIIDAIPVATTAPEAAPNVVESVVVGP